MNTWDYLGVAMVGLLIHRRAWRIAPVFFTVQCIQLAMIVWYKHDRDAYVHMAGPKAVRALAYARVIGEYHIVRELGVLFAFLSVLSLYNSSRKGESQGSPVARAGRAVRRVPRLLVAQAFADERRGQRNRSRLQCSAERDESALPCSDDGDVLCSR